MELPKVEDLGEKDKVLKQHNGNRSRTHSPGKVLKLLKILEFL